MINDMLKDLSTMRIHEDRQLDLDFSLSKDIAVTSSSLDISFKVRKRNTEFPDPEHNPTDIKNQSTATQKTVMCIDPGMLCFFDVNFKI